MYGIFKWNVERSSVLIVFESQLSSAKAELRKIIRVKIESENFFMETSFDLLFDEAGSYAFLYFMSVILRLPFQDGIKTM